LAVNIVFKVKMFIALVVGGITTRGVRWWF